MTPLFQILLFSLAVSNISGSQIFMTVSTQKVTPPVTFYLYVGCSLIENEKAKDRIQRRADLEKSEEDVIKVKNIVITRNGRRIAHVSEMKAAEALVPEDNMKVTGQLGRYLYAEWTSPGRQVGGVYGCEIDAVDVDGKEIHFSKRDSVMVREPGLEEVIDEMRRLHSQFDVRPVDRTQAGTAKCGSSTNWASGPPDSELDSPRFTTVDVQFDKPFVQTPILSARFTGADAMAGSGAVRVALNVREVTSRGFKIECITWMGATVEDLQFSWIAFTPPVDY